MGTQTSPLKMPKQVQQTPPNTRAELEMPRSWSGQILPGEMEVSLLVKVSIQVRIFN